MVCALFLIQARSADADADETQLAVQLRETQEALRAARERCVTLNAALVRTQKDLETARARFAEAYAQLEEEREAAAAIRLQAANLLVNGGEVPESRVIADLLRNQQRLQQLHQDIDLELRQYRTAVEALLNSLEPDRQSATRRLLDIHMDKALRSLRQAEALTAPVEPTEPAQARRTARVLAVNNGLAVIVLDVGRRDGARLGSTWRIVGHNEARVDVRLIATRQTLSAATVVEGRLRQVAPGNEARRLDEPERSEND